MSAQQLPCKSTSAVVLIISKQIAVVSRPILQNLQCRCHSCTYLVILWYPVQGAASAYQAHSHMHASSCSEKFVLASHEHQCMHTPVSFPSKLPLGMKSVHPFAMGGIGGALSPSQHLAATPGPPSVLRMHLSYDVHRMQRFGPPAAPCLAL